jgi:DNA-binding NarL/FixJ family response regulator
VPRPPDDRFLIVEDHPVTARALARWLGNRRSTTIAHSVRDAKQLARRLDGFTGAVVDITLPDGSGFEVIDSLRKSCPALPVLVITGSLEHHVANRCQSLGVEFVFKPATGSNLRAFASRAALTRRMDSRLAQVVYEKYVHPLALTPRETQILWLALRGLKRSSLAQELGIAPNTVKSLVRVLLTKTEQPSLHALAHSILCEAWVARFADESPPSEGPGQGEPAGPKVKARRARILGPLGRRGERRNEQGDPGR